MLRTSRCRRRQMGAFRARIEPTTRDCRAERAVPLCVAIRDRERGPGRGFLNTPEWVHTRPRVPRSTVEEAVKTYHRLWTVLGSCSFAVAAAAVIVACGDSANGGSNSSAGNGGLGG